MKQIFQSIKQHPYSVFFYLVYCWLWYGACKVILHPMREGGLLVLAGIFTAAFFIFVSLLNAYHNDDYKFYLSFIGFIIIPVAIAFYLESIQVYLFEKAGYCCYLMPAPLFAASPPSSGLFAAIGFSCVGFVLKQLV